MILREGHEHSPTSRKPRECFCKPTLREIGQDHGEDHLRLILMLMTGTKINSAELYANMIKAVSSVLVRKPDLMRRPSLVDDFNTIDLGDLKPRGHERHNASPRRNPYCQQIANYLNRIDLVRLNSGVDLVLGRSRQISSLTYANHWRAADAKPRHLPELLDQRHPSNGRGDRCQDCQKGARFIRYPGCSLPPGLFFGRRDGFFSDSASNNPALRFSLSFGSR